MSAGFGKRRKQMPRIPHTKGGLTIIRPDGTRHYVSKTEADRQALRVVRDTHRTQGQNYLDT